MALLANCNHLTGGDVVLFRYDIVIVHCLCALLFNGQGSCSSSCGSLIALQIITVKVNVRALYV